MPLIIMSYMPASCVHSIDQLFTSVHSVINRYRVVKFGLTLITELEDFRAVSRTGHYFGQVNQSIHRHTPQLEYGTEAWNPYTSGAAEGLERVQKMAARFVNRDYQRFTSASGLVSDLGWDQLHTRHLLTQSTMLYRIHHHLVNIYLPHFITQAPYISRRDHNLKLSVPEATIDSYKFSFYPRTTCIWNQLPATAVTAPTVTAFQGAALPVIRGLEPPVGSRML